MPTYELWESADGTELAFMQDVDRDEALLTSLQELHQTWVVEADDWTAAMTRYHEHMGWEPYVPMDTP
jgi:hypothetical protein